MLGWLPQSGKRPRRPLEATTDLHGTTSRLLTISDPVSRLSYLTDTGAETIVLPPRAEDPSSPTDNIQLKAANGSAIRTFDERAVNVDLGLGRHFAWTFTIAEVSKPIIGADILRFVGLLVDLGRKRLMDANTFYTVSVSYERSSVS